MSTDGPGELPRLLAKAEQQLKEAEQQREEAEQQREAAEKKAQQSLPQDLRQYLAACHSLDLGIQVVTNPASTTQGDATNPVGRIYPRRIVPWEDFADRQEEIWEKLSASPGFTSRAAFPSEHQLAYVKSVLSPISSEVGLRNFERGVVENAVRKLFDETYKDQALRESLGLRGTITFESHTNLGSTSNSISDTPEDMSISTPSRSKSKENKRPRKARGKGNRADLFCIYRPSEGQSIPVMAIEYKAPHKASVDEIATGLESEIVPDRDVIGKDGQGFSFHSRTLAAAIVTQLFSYMVGKGLQFGYVCTGQLFVFLWIPSDPSEVRFRVCVPSQDVTDGDENRLRQTAVAQVFAFLLQALRAAPPSESWYDQADTLGEWEVEYDDILSKIPVSERKPREPRESPYKPQHWKGFMRSPIRTRSSWSPTPQPSTTTKNKNASTATRGDDGKRRRTQRFVVRQSGQQQEQLSIHSTRMGIDKRPYCSQGCLSGLATGGSLDPRCPNIRYHGSCHINAAEFRRLFRAQLATDRGDHADCQCTYLGGRHGMLYKLRLSSHGYTLVAKGIRHHNRNFLLRECEIYDKLQQMQGRYVPVCLGYIDLELPYHFDGATYHSFLFLGWVGPSLSRCLTPATKQDLAKRTSMALKQLHKHGVLHCDIATRNILYDESSGNVMFIDFSKSEVCTREPLRAANQNALGQGGKLGGKGKACEFADEHEATMALIIGDPMVY